MSDQSGVHGGREDRAAIKRVQGEHEGRAVKARAPIRLDLAGGWTDVPPFSEREGGAVVNLAVNRYSYVTVRARPAGFSLHSEDYHTSAEAPTVETLPERGELALLRASVLVGLEPRERDAHSEGQATGAAARAANPPGFQLRSRCETPPGSGTGSSAAVAVAVAGAVASFIGAPLAAHEAARQAIRAERTYLGVAGGTQDQLAAAYGGANFMEFRDPQLTVSPLRLHRHTVAELEQRLALAYSGVSRVSGTIAQNVMAAYMAGNHRTVDALRTMRRLAYDAKDCLLMGDVTALGELLAENWRCQKALHPSVTNSGLDALYDRAMRAGALGGKAVGAGGGGCLLFLAGADREAEVRQAVQDAGAQMLDFGLEWHGLQVWRAE